MRASHERESTSALRARLTHMDAELEAAQARAQRVRELESSLQDARRRCQRLEAHAAGLETESSDAKRSIAALSANAIALSRRAASAEADNEAYARRAKEVERSSKLAVEAADAASSQAASVAETSTSTMIEKLEALLSDSAPAIEESTKHVSHEARLAVMLARCRVLRSQAASGILAVQRAGEASSAAQAAEEQLDALRREYDDLSRRHNELAAPFGDQLASLEAVARHEPLGRQEDAGHVQAQEPLRRSSLAAPVPRRSSGAGSLQSEVEALHAALAAGAQRAVALEAREAEVTALLAQLGNVLNGTQTGSA
jgi:hypothetical protein